MRVWQQFQVELRHRFSRPRHRLEERVVILVATTEGGEGGRVGVRHMSGPDPPLLAAHALGTAVGPSSSFNICHTLTPQRDLRSADRTCSHKSHYQITWLYNYKYMFTVHFEF